VKLEYVLRPAPHLQVKTLLTMGLVSTIETGKKQPATSLKEMNHFLELLEFEILFSMNLYKGENQFELIQRNLGEKDNNDS
jgi:hypothetical protein